MSLRSKRTREILEQLASRQGHDLCHYEPVAIKELMDLYGVQPPLDLALPPREALREGCRNFECSLYGAAEPEPRPRDPAERLANPPPGFACFCGGAALGFLVAVLLISGFAYGTAHYPPEHARCGMCEQRAELQSYADSTATYACPENHRTVYSRPWHRPLSASKP